MRGTIILRNQALRRYVARTEQGQLVLVDCRCQGGLDAGSVVTGLLTRHGAGEWRDTTGGRIVDVMVRRVDVNVTDAMSWVQTAA